MLIRAPNVRNGWKADTTLSRMAAARSQGETEPLSNLDAAPAEGQFSAVLLAALAALRRRSRWRRRWRRRHVGRRRRRGRWRRGWRRSRAGAQRNDELQEAAVAPDVAVELALIAGAHV